MAPKKKVVEKARPVIKKTVAAPKQVTATKTKASQTKAVVKTEPKPKTLVPKKEPVPQIKTISNPVVLKTKVQTGEGWRRHVLRIKQHKKS